MVGCRPLINTYCIGNCGGGGGKGGIPQFVNSQGRYLPNPYFIQHLNKLWVSLRAIHVKENRFIHWHIYLSYNLGQFIANIDTVTPGIALETISGLLISVNL